VMTIEQLLALGTLTLLLVGKIPIPDAAERPGPTIDSGGAP
jgi:hypothetical protein